MLTLTEKIGISFIEGTFLDVVRRGFRYYGLVRQELSALEEKLEVAGDAVKPLADDLNFLGTMLDDEVGELPLPRTHSRLERLRESQGPDLIHQVQSLREAFEDDLSDLAIFFPNQARAKCYGNPSALFGKEVYSKFGQFQFDLREAANCYATDNFTACVFHLMRVVEQALHLLAHKLRVKLKNRVDYADWREIQHAIKKKLDPVRQLKRGPKKDLGFQTYSDLADQCQYFKELWRDDLMHSRAQFNEVRAQEVVSRVGKFLKLLTFRFTGNQSASTNGKAD